mmetsp:Transcript_409/g.1165  ORF Transcript_409/g.1165 Transcript_409/m.1165 type:complete len:224 (-) Transcript_409:1214-1885(-)
MNQGSALLLVFLLAHPALLEASERGEDAAANPDPKLPFHHILRRDDLHPRLPWGLLENLPFQPLSHVGQHGTSASQNDAIVKLFPHVHVDLRYALHHQRRHALQGQHAHVLDGLGVLERLNQPRVEEHLGHLEPVAADLDFSPIGELVRHGRDVGMLLLVENALAYSAHGLLEIREDLLHAPLVVGLRRAPLVVVQLLHVKSPFVLLGLGPLESVPWSHFDVL